MIIKKYSNRKLYTDGKYINLTDVIGALKNGQDVTIVSHGDEMDVTQETLLEALKLIKIDSETLKELIIKG